MCVGLARELGGLDAAKAERATDHLRELASGFAGLVTGDDPSPWTGATLTTTTIAQKAMDEAARLVQRWLALVSALQAVESAIPLRPCTDVPDVQRVLDVVAAIDAALARYDPSVFSLGLDRLASSLSPGRSDCWSNLGNLYQR